jgi:hypothetical protein
MKNIVDPAHRTPAVLWFLLTGCVVLFLGALLTRVGRDRPDAAAGSNPGTQASRSGETSTRSRSGRESLQTTAEEIVSSKVHEFANNRLRVAHALAKRANAKVPPDVEAFSKPPREDWENPPNL